MADTAYTITEIAGITNGRLIRQANNRPVNRLVIDSRKLLDPENSLFFALSGPRNDGHHFVRELYERGVRNFVVSKVSENTDLLYEANIILVENSLEAMQKLAAFHRSQFDIPVVGITGSNGKTIVKEWLFQLLQDQHNVVRSPRSYNSQVGVPLSVWNMNGQHTLAIFEAGISQPGEMDKLNKIIQPETGIFINVREAHNEHFKNHDEKAREKLRLFEGCKTLIYSGDYPEIETAINAADLKRNCRLLRWSSNDPAADLYLHKIGYQKHLAILNAVYHSHKITIEIPFNDNGSIENAAVCLLYCLDKGMPAEELALKFKALQPVAMRLQMLEGINGCSIVNDTYNSDMGSLEIALDFLNQQQHLQKRTLILSDILQTGIKASPLYTKVAELCAEKRIDRIIGIGPEISQHAAAFKHLGQFYPSTEAFLAAFHSEMFSNELVLIKGARPFKFERISKRLEYKSHETVLEINLDALIHNLNFFKSRLKADTRLMVMVKAFSYGIGSFEIAHLLEYEKVAYLAVAYADEGIDLRKAGVKLPIMVMNPDSGSFESLIRNNLEPELYSLRILREFAATIERMQVNRPHPVHLKLDTGMHRLGFEAPEVQEVISLLKRSPMIKVASVFTHLSSSEDASGDDFTRLQLQRFKEMADNVEQELGQKFLRHALNSNGILRFSEAQYDMVRLGIGLYGYVSDPLMAASLKPSARLRTLISQIKEVQAGEYVGYGRSGKITKPTRIATVPVGYADGLSRQLGNGKGGVWINDNIAPIVGNVCMDMCMVDVTEIACAEGDEVEVFGENISIETLASQMNTIPYEVISNISRRVKRVYYRD
jgi:Alr-MurF fusion protein